MSTSRVENRVTRGTQAEMAYGVTKIFEKETLGTEAAWTGRGTHGHIGKGDLIQSKYGSREIILEAFTQTES